MLESMQATMNSAIASGMSVPKSSNVSKQKACVLDGACLDLNLLREDNRLELLEILDSIPSSQKCLVLDPQLGGRLNHVLVEGARILRENGVTSFRELRSFGEEFDPETTYVYACRATVPHVQAIAKQIKAAIRQDHKNHFHVLVLPRRTFLCQHFLRDVENYVTLHDFRLDLVAFDKDVLSLEWDSCYHENKVRDDPTSLEFVAQSLLKLENFYGQPRRIRGLGPMAKGVLERLAKQRFKIHALKLKDRGYFGASPLFGSKPPPRLEEDDHQSTKEWELLVLDREVDLVTPLATPLTYEGLIDELMGGIKNSTVKLDKETTPLNSNERMYSEIRDLHIEGLGTWLGHRAKEIRDIHDKFRSNQSLAQIHDFVKKIPGLTRDYEALQTHIAVSEKLKKTTDSRQFRERWTRERSMLEGELVYETLEDLVAQQIPPMLALRFVSMQSLTGGGIKANKFDALKRLIVHSYGFELLPTLHNLEKAGLFKKKPDLPLSMMLIETPFALLRKQLALIVDDVDPVNPVDAAYVSSGYAPLSVRLVERPDWTPQLLAHLPGPALDYNPADYDRKRLVDMMKAPSSPLFLPNNNTSPPPSKKNNAKKKTPLVVYIVGGVTYAEIAAFRFLSKKQDFPYDIVVASTNITNGTAFVKSLVYEIDNKLQKKKA